MSEITREAKKVFRSFRATLAVVGALMFIAGLIVLIWPAKTASFVAVLFGAYLVVAGLVYVGIGIFASSKRGWARLGHIALGIVYMAAGIIMFANLGLATITLAAFIGVLVGITWIVDGIVALTLLGKDGSAVWTLLYALLSIIAGITLLFSPIWAATLLFLVLGISLVVLGLIQIVRAITITHDAKTFVKRARMAADQ